MAKAAGNWFHGKRPECVCVARCVCLTQKSSFEGVWATLNFSFAAFAAWPGTVQQGRKGCWVPTIRPTCCWTPGSENCVRPPAHGAPSLRPPPAPSPLFLPRPDSRSVSSLRQISTCYHSTLFLEASIESKTACPQDAAMWVLAVVTRTSLMCLFLCIHWYWSFTQQKRSISAATGCTLWNHLPREQIGKPS